MGANMMSRPRHVLVTGAGGPSGQAAVSALKARGFQVTAVDMTPVVHQADHFSLVPAARDPRYVEVHETLIAAGGVSWFFPTVSEELALAAHMAPRLRAHDVSIFISGESAVRICGDKWETACALRVAGIPVPTSAVGAAEAPAVQALGFPLVSRPRVGRGGRGVVVHERPGVPPQADDPIWQEFMPGTEYDVLLARHPDAPHPTLMLQVFEKTVLREGLVGNAVEVTPVAAPDVAALAEGAAAVLALTGPIDMDIRRGSDGVARVLEVNARIGAHALRAPRVFDVLVKLFTQGHCG